MGWTSHFPTLFGFQHVICLFVVARLSRCLLELHWPQKCSLGLALMWEITVAEANFLAILKTVLPSETLWILLDHCGVGSEISLGVGTFWSQWRILRDRRECWPHPRGSTLHLLRRHKRIPCECSNVSGDSFSQVCPLYTLLWVCVHTSVNML